MLRQLLNRIYKWLTKKPAYEVDDPVLGRLTFEENSWQGSFPTEYGELRLSVGGYYEPDKNLIQSARKVYENLDSFLMKTHEYLKYEAEKSTSYEFREEVIQQKISDICFTCPDSPGTAMVFFDGPDNYHVWHCEYVNSEFRNLTYDT